jgi:hypothetical protein
MAEAEELQFVDSQERLYFAEAHLGEEMRTFLLSNVGRLLHGRAKQEHEDAKDELMALELDAPDYRQRALQIHLRSLTARTFMRWCADAIANGEAAYQQLESYRS